MSNQEGTVATAPPPSDPAYDIEFFWDPVCPFAWITSRWVEKVSALKDYRVDWRFISLRLINKDKDYATEFPPEYEYGHTAGLRMLRVAAAVRQELGREKLGPLVTAYGRSYWDNEPDSGLPTYLSTRDHAEEVLVAAGIDTGFARHLDNTEWDAMLDAESELALSRTGHDVGTPIITFRMPDVGGATETMSFFGPVISRVPDDNDAVRLWEAVTTLAAFPGFAEMKRSLREKPRLNILGGLNRPAPDGDAPETAPEYEDWQGGHRRGHLRSDNP